MLLRIRFYDGKKFLFALTMNNCTYKDFKNHFTSLTYDEYRSFRAVFYEVEDGIETLVADHLV